MFYVLSHIFHTDPQFDTLDAAITYASELADDSVEIYQLDADGQPDVLWPPL